MKTPMAWKGKHPALVILGSLLKGVPVKIDGEEYHLADNVLCVKRSVYAGIGQEPVGERLIRIDMSVGAFVKMCERLTLTEEQLFEIAANTVLNDIRRKR